MALRTPLGTGLAAALLVLLAGCADDPAPVADDPADHSGDRQKPRGGKDDAGGTSESPDASAGQRTSAVYYVSDTRRAGPRLYREFRRGEGDALGSALDLLAEHPLDPDYRTLWQPGQLVGAAEGDGTVDVQVDAAVRDRPDGMSKAEASAAVQQVVYTVQAAVQDRAPVRFTSGGDPIDRVLGVPTTDPVSNGPMLQVLSHVNLTAPEQGASVSGGRLQVSGVGNSFEANLGWEVRRGDTVVKDGYTTMSGWMGDKLYPFEMAVDVGDLAPGDYTLRVTTDDPSGGEGVGAMTDDKAFTVG